MASGLPVVAAAAGGVPSVIGRPGETGLLFPPGDAEAAAAAIRGLMRDAEARWACCCGRVAAAAVVRRAAGQRVLQSQGGATLPLSCSRRHRVSRAARAEMERWSWRSATQQILQDHYPAAVAAAGGQPPPAVVPAAA
jgi:glycosyltransferase involved in cell wall biosynthesis